MIPLKLRIKNFVSYGTLQEVDFEPYSLICLSGKNGHGKSALLDALTWVLWGQARKPLGTAKADEGLLHNGQTQMMVSLDFTSNGVLYRVKREFSLLDKKNQSSLEFGILDRETGTIKALTDKTIRATQDKICQAVGLGFDAFINSAFLKQGQSHEFSKKSPKERKEILAAILGLEHFEQIRRLALDTAKEALHEKEQTLTLLAPLEEELKEKTLVQERLKNLDEALHNLQEREKDLQLEYARNKERSQQASFSKVEAEKVKFQQEHLARQIDEEYEHIRTSVHTWREMLRKHHDQSFSLVAEKERQTIQDELSRMQLRTSQKLKRKEEYFIKKELLREHLQKKTDSLRDSLETHNRRSHELDLALNTAENNYAMLLKKSLEKTAELETISEKLKQKVTLQADPSEKIEVHEKFLERKKEYYHSFVSRAQSLKSVLEELAQKIQLITSSHEARCPVCEQVTDKEKLTEKFHKEERLRVHQIQRLSKICGELKASLVHEHTSLENLKKQRELFSLHKAELSQWENQHREVIKETQDLSRELSEVTETLNRLIQQREILAQERQAITLNNEQKDPLTQQLEQDLAILHREIEAIPHDEETEQSLRTRLSLLVQKAEQDSSFMKELAFQDERKKTIYEKCDRVRALKKQLSILSPTPLFERMLTDEQLLEQENLLAQSLAHLTKEKENIIHQKGSFEAQSRALQQKEYTYKKQLEVVKECTNRYDQYTAIASAFSKEGIQALLIEDALPEIEEEANNLISRLTDNQSHITIDSLKDTKSGKTKETLDIIIADSVGVRPYEMFSGGEAFRIDFSLRVALSKLLARRAGTALQTLIIDEGFGSQDEDGLAYIMEALHSIKEDFAKVIVVSHLPSLKEQFPVHFQINKTPQGSTVTSIEHC